MNPRPTGPKPVALPSCATPRNWQGQKDSNPRHAVLETAALPTELYPCILPADLSAHFDAARSSLTRHVIIQNQRCNILRKWRRRWDSNPCGPFVNPNGLANRPLQPLEYFSTGFLAERVGFEPTVPCGITGFQDRLLKPLGHLSVSLRIKVYW